MKNDECWFCRERKANCMDPLSPSDSKPVVCQPCALGRLDRAMFYNNYLRNIGAKEG